MWRVSATEKAVEELLEELLHVCFVGAEGMNMVAVPEHKSGQYAGWMGGMRRDEKVEVEFLFEEGGMDLILSNGDCKVKVVNGGDTVTEYPFEAVEAGDAGLEL